jgi:molybdenum cofactor biosynthesis enzyme MoaA
MSHYDFANILFAGPCNLRCPYCIGRQIDPGLNRDNLNDFPLRNLDRFVHLLQSNYVTDIILTGTTTDPQLYRHQTRLLAWLRAQIPGAHVALHTNGQLAFARWKCLTNTIRSVSRFPLLIQTPTAT